MLLRRSVALAVLAATVVLGTMVTVAPPASATGTVTTGSIVSAGLTRTYRMYRPSSLATTTKAPLIVALHEAGGSGAGFETQTGFDAVADNRNWLVVYPDSQVLHTSSGDVKQWQYGCCEAAYEGTQDLTFLRDLVAKLVAQQNADPRRVWVTGFSVGASMADRVACDAADLVAAVAPVNGAEALDHRCQPTHPVSTYIVHGTVNDTEGCRSGTLPYCYKGAVSYHPSSSGLAQYWHDRDLCPSQSSSSTSGAVTTSDWGSCSGSTGVRYSSIQNGPHCWPGEPGSGAACKAMSATAAIAAFFAGKYAAPASAPVGTANDYDTVPIPIIPGG